MPSNGGWLRDQYSRFFCTYLGHSRKLFDDKNLIQDAKMLQYPLTTDQKENQFLFLSEIDDTGK